MANNSILAMVKNRLRSNLHQLNPQISEEDALRLARFLLDDLDVARWRLVTAAPTKEMIDASMTAMRKNRKREGWVGENEIESPTHLVDCFQCWARPCRWTSETVTADRP